MNPQIEDLPLAVHVPLGAQVLGICPQTYRALCRSGEIPAKHIGNKWVISRDRLLEYLNGGEAHAA